MAKKIFSILTLFILVALAISLTSAVLAADLNINAHIDTPGGGGGPPPPPPPPPPPVYGCTDPTAINYNPRATVDNGSCQYAILGCTDPTAINYNPSATTNDGSCEYPLLGCTDSLATNYDFLANTDDGSCEYALAGCTDPLASNYNPNATLDDNSCIYQVSGCTNPLAINYNSQAIVDDGSCLIVGCTDPTAVNYNPQANVDNGACSYDKNLIPGCTDASALNYNPSANVDNGSCAYLVSGCTDVRALNYNPTANLNNGSCVYSLPSVPIADWTAATFKPTYYFYTNNYGLELFLGGLFDNNIDLLLGNDLIILISDSFPKEVRDISATFNQETFFFNYDSESRQYLLKLNSFTKIDKVKVKLAVNYLDGSSQSRDITITLHPLGQVFSKLPKDQTRIYGISVYLYDENNNLLVALKKINDNGTYGFMVKNGRYKLMVFDNGQKIYDGNLFEVRNNIVNQKIGLSLFEQIIDAVKRVLDNEVVEETNKYTAPAVVTITSLSTALAIPWWSFVNYLQYLFTEPLAWLLRRKKKGWGVVYNSITKRPIDLAVVRLYDKASGRLLKSRVTDKAGRYNFLVAEGIYILEVVKPNIIFPSKVLNGMEEDKQFINLYYGQAITIGRDQQGIITANIPVDPQEAVISDKVILRKYFWYKIRKNVSLIGPILSVISFAIYPGLLMGSFMAIHLLFYLLFKRLVAKEKVTSWGVVLDAKTLKPLASAIAKIYSPEYDKMLESQVSDRYGRYGFLAGNNIYYLTAAKAGYQESKTGTIDLSHKKSDEVLGQDIKLQSLTKGQISPTEKDIKKAEEPVSEASQPTEIVAGPIPPVQVIEEILIPKPIQEESALAELPQESSDLEEMAEKLKEQVVKETALPPENKEDITLAKSTIDNKPKAKLISLADGSLEEIAEMIKAHNQELLKETEDSSVEEGSMTANDPNSFSQDTKESSQPFAEDKLG